MNNMMKMAKVLLATVVILACGNDYSASSCIQTSAVKLVDLVPVATYPNYYNYGGYFAIENNQVYAIDRIYAVNSITPTFKLTITDLSGLAPVVSQSRDIKIEAGDQIRQNSKIGNYIFIAGNNFVSIYDAKTLNLVNYSVMPFGWWSIAFKSDGIYCIFDHRNNLFYFLPAQDLPIFSAAYPNSVVFDYGGLQLEANFIAFRDNKAYVFMSAFQDSNIHNVPGKLVHVLLEYDWSERKLIQSKMLNNAEYGYMGSEYLIGINQGKIYYQVNFDDGGSSKIMYYDISSGEIVVVHDFYEPNYQTRVEGATISNGYLFLPYHKIMLDSQLPERPAVLVKSLTGQPDKVMKFNFYDSYSTVIDGDKLYTIETVYKGLPVLHVYRIFE